MSAAQRARWGWHQLSSEAAQRLVAGACVRPGDLVIDAGAGTGAITKALVTAGARVLAVELHPHRARLLRERFHDAPVTVLQVDLVDLWLPRRPFRVVANPPFSVTTALLRRLVSPGSRLIRADLVVPAHVAARWSSLSAPGAARWQRQFDARVAGRLPIRAFTPPPPHTPKLLVIERRTTGS